MISDHPPLADLPVPLERDGFMRTLIRHLTGALDDVVGGEEAAGFVAIVGQQMGRDLNVAYRSALGEERLSRRQVADVLVDLKRRIRGDFYVIEENDERIVLGNNACPFGDRVLDRPAMCMMTSNVFGHIAAQNLGYARVTLDETIAQGAPGCRVTVHLRPPTDADASGAEYFAQPEGTHE